jgi:hypothetical protein
MEGRSGQILKQLKDIPIEQSGPVCSIMFMFKFSVCSLFSRRLYEKWIVMKLSTQNQREREREREPPQEI